MRLQRRVLAFARDTVGRLLAPLRELARSEHGAVRAVAYQLEQGLGSALTLDLAPTLAELSAEAERELVANGVEVGRLCVVLSATLRQGALEQRAALLSAYEAGAVLPARLGRPCYPVARLSPAAWVALGYVPLGSWALRCDLAERAAVAVSEGLDVARVLAALGVPRAERPRVAQELLRRVAAPTESELRE